MNPQMASTLCKNDPEQRKNSVVRKKSPEEPSYRGRAHPPLAGNGNGHNRNVYLLNLTEMYTSATWQKCVPPQPDRNVYLPNLTEMYTSATWQKCVPPQPDRNVYLLNLTEMYTSSTWQKCVPPQPDRNVYLLNLTEMYTSSTWQKCVPPQPNQYKITGLV